jgi:prophage antirepressor-like protein
MAHNYSMELRIPFIHNKVVIFNIHITGTKEQPLFSAEDVFKVTGFGWWYTNGVNNVRDFNELEMVITFDDPTDEQSTAEKLNFLLCYMYGTVRLTELGLFKLISRSTLDISPMFVQWTIELLKDIHLNGLAPRDDKTYTIMNDKSYFYILIPRILLTLVLVS